EVRPPARPGSGGDVLDLGRAPAGQLPELLAVVVGRGEEHRGADASELGRVGSARTRIHVGDADRARLRAIGPPRLLARRPVVAAEVEPVPGDPELARIAPAGRVQRLEPLGPGDAPVTPPQLHVAAV